MEPVTAVMEEEEHDENSDDDSPPPMMMTMIARTKSSSSSLSISKKCFSPLPARRLATPLVPPTCQLCPSMDLVVLGLPSAAAAAAMGTQQRHSRRATRTAATAAAIATTIWLHRTVSAQKVASLVIPVVSSEEEEEQDNRDVEKETNDQVNATATLDRPQSITTITTPRGNRGVTRIGWRPDGRILALAHANGQVTLYPIEDIVSATSSSSSALTLDPMEETAAAASSLDFYDEDGRGLTDGDDQNDPAGGSCHKITWSLPSGPITGLTWAHVGRPHPAWSRQHDIYEYDSVTHYHSHHDPDAPQPFEPEQDAVWSFRSRYVDRAGDILPPRFPQPVDASSRIASTTNAAIRSRRRPPENSIVPVSRTPLSVLCVTTPRDGLHLYLHGRYPIVMGLPLPNEEEEEDDDHKNDETTLSNLTIAVSNQLDHFVLHREGSRCLTIFSFPSLAREKFTLQTLSALSCSILSHLERMRISLTEIKGSWISSLKPLDLKLDSLVQLLRKYGLDRDGTSVNTALLHYILSGHTRQSPNLSNAMDQFFTGVQMNDQLVQRMERSLTVAVAKVETQVRQGLLRPAQALVYRTSELHALARALVLDQPLLLPVSTTEQVNTACAMLLLQVEQALTDLIDARFRLRDLVAWLRSAGAQVKARGTASNSVQRDNAQKRRVSDAVVQRMLQYLQETEKSKKTRSSASNASNSLAEKIIGLRFSDCFAAESDENTKPQLDDPTSTQPLVTMVAQTALSVESLLQGPREYMKQSVRCTQLTLPPLEQPAGKLMALTMRLGRGGAVSESDPFGDDETCGFFAPLCGTETDPSAATFRQWTILAQVAEAAATASADPLHCFVQLFAIPLTWTDTEDEDDSDEHGVATRVFWTTRLALPPKCLVRAIAFYGDDGKSSLSSGVDSGSGKERRQALGLLVQRAETLELWLVPYDKCAFSQRPFLESVSASSLWLHVPADESRQYLLEPMPEGFDEDALVPNGVLYARTRSIQCELKDHARYCLMMSGSRGVGAVLSTHSTGTSLDLFDLEEDEEEDVDDAEGGGEQSMVTD